MVVLEVGSDRHPEQIGAQVGYGFHVRLLDIGGLLVAFIGHVATDPGINF